MYSTLSILVIAVIWKIIAQESRTNLFHNKLYNVLPNKGPNIIVSPFNVHVILSLLYQGSAGDTAITLKQHLNVTNKFVNAENYKYILAELDTASNVTMILANMVCVKRRYKLKESYIKIARYYFAADVENMDFMRRKKAATDMNTWISKKTHEKIQNMISSNDLDETTRAIILNAITFSSDWMRPFSPNETYIDSFYTSDTDFVSVNMMTMVDYFLYIDHATLDAKILKIPYADKRFSMIFVLPNSRTGITSLERNIILEDIAFITNDTRMDKKLIRLYVPKFKFENPIELKEALTQIGLGKIFSYFAKFTNMITTNDTLRFDRLIQKTSLEVTEFGSEAGTASVAKKRRTKLTPGTVIFKADHPFMFYIIVDFETVNVTNNIFFMGRVSKPVDTDI